MKPDVTAGAISLDADMPNSRLTARAEASYPIVVMDRVVKNPYIASVLANNIDSMSRLVQSLADKGYRRFGYLAGQESLDNTERYAAFTDTLARNGIAFDQRFFYHGDYREKSGYQAAKLMLLSKKLPQVLVCASDSMALGAMRAFRENGLVIPRDIAVTGFDDTGSAEMTGLTTVSIPRYESGFLAARKLLAMLDGEDAGEATYLTAKPVFRSTTRD
jgi:LacI family transcriptional regulator